MNATQLSFDFLELTPIENCACCHWVRSCTDCCKVCKDKCACPHTCEQGMHHTQMWLNNILAVTGGINEYFLNAQPENIKRYYAKCQSTNHTPIKKRG